MLAEIPLEQLATAVDYVADELLAEAGISGPPVDAFQLAEQLRLVVGRDGIQDGRARLVRLGGTSGAILLADEPRAERRQWAIAHEVGEWAAHRVFAGLGMSLVELRPTWRERIASELAGSLLLPRDWITADGRACDWDLLELKRIYATASHELIARRMLAVGPAAIVTLFDQSSPQWRRSNLLPRVPPLTDAESVVWRLAFERGLPARYDDGKMPDGIADVRCWPIHEPGWRREILRTELHRWE